MHSLCTCALQVVKNYLLKYQAPQQVNNQGGCWRGSYQESTNDTMLHVISKQHSRPQKMSGFTVSSDYKSVLRVQMLIYSAMDNVCLAIISPCNTCCLY
jgi:hypothetical protein